MNLLHVVVGDDDKADIHNSDNDQQYKGTSGVVRKAIEHSDIDSRKRLAKTCLHRGSAG